MSGDLFEDHLFSKIVSSDPVDTLYVSLPALTDNAEVAFNLSKRVPLRIVHPEPDQPVGKVSWGLFLE